jgi:tetratricopeptide (TPR) repeat protein
LAIDDKLANAWIGLGNVLCAQKNFTEGINAYRRALAIDDKLPDAWYNFGIALYNQKNLPGAIEAYKKAINLLPDDAEAHCNLGHALRDHGEFAAGLKALQKGHELGTRQPGWPYPSAAWVKHCQQLLTLEQKLPAVLQGGPAEVADLLALADLCRRYKKRYRDSAALFAKAFAAEPKAAENLNKGHRYHAACAAALAGAGKGVDADKLDTKEKSGLRQEALRWLRAHLAAYSMRLATGKQEDRTLVGQRLGHWMVNRDLVGIRDAAVLTKLPAEEQEACRKFWAEVEALRKKAQDGTP